ncbi:MAG: hypothetical protein ACOC2E_08115, partial [Bacteroidota bacterium]
AVFFANLQGESGFEKADIKCPIERKPNTLYQNKTLFPPTDPPFLTLIRFFVTFLNINEFFLGVY